MKKILNWMNNKALALCGALALTLGSAFAEGESGGSVGTIDVQPITDLANSIKAFLSSAVSIILPILGAVLVYFFVRWAWRVMKSFMNAGK